MEQYTLFDIIKAVGMGPEMVVRVQIFNSEYVVVASGNWWQKQIRDYWKRDVESFDWYLNKQILTATVKGELTI